MKYHSLVFAILATGTFSLPVHGVTIRVPTDQPTIQAGIDSAMVGDTVLVADGTYTGEGNRDIDFGGKNIVLRSENGPENTIIDCEGNAFEPHRFVFDTTGLDSTTLIEGFTIQGGYAEVDGGAVFLYHSSPSFRNCIFTGNSAASMGGAIAIIEAAPKIEWCVFIYNYALDGGGGILSVNTGSGVCIVNCTFHGNSAFHGGAIYNYGSSPIITNCLFTENEQYPESVWYGEGMAVFCYTAIPYDYDIDITCTDIYGNEGGDWVGCIAADSNLNGNFCLDPLYCDTANGDYTIQDNSPCAPENNSCGVLIGALGVGCNGNFVEEDPNGELPEGFTLSQNYPNPFNPFTTIKFSIPERAHVTITVYDLLGRQVAVLADEELRAGNYYTEWNATGFASGIYFYRLEAGNFCTSKKMILLK